MPDYRNRPVRRMTETDYDAALARLAEQLAAAMVAQGKAVELGDAAGAAVDILAGTWRASLTSREWLAEAAERLGVDVDQQAWS